MDLPIKKNIKKLNRILEEQKHSLIKNWRKNRIITTESVLRAFQSVHREIFVDPSYNDISYSDNPLPIGSGQTISQPTTVAMMLQLLNILPGNCVLEIGTGSGYNAALLANLAKFVVTIERHEKLVKKARKNLLCVGLDNIKVIEGDGKLGYVNHAPYDRIIITAAADKVPQNLKDQLIIGGFIVAPIGPTYGCEMHKIQKISQNNFQTSSHGVFSFVPLI